MYLTTALGDMQIENIARILKETTAPPPAVRHMRTVFGGRAAPKLMVDYVCPKCGGAAIVDAYDGPPLCAGKPTDRHYQTFMTPERLVT